jgi:Putative peptidoglycan binding domain
MRLQSKLFSGEPRLEACLISDPAHITSGTMGPFVRKIQTALKELDGVTIAATELSTMRYGATTHAAVLAFKKKRRLANPDGIIGRTTLATLDNEMAAKERSAPDPGMQQVNAANTRRLAALNKAELALATLKRDFGNSAPPFGDPVVEALQRQLFVPLDSNFWTFVDRLIAMLKTNRLTVAPFLIDKTEAAFAHVDKSNDPKKGITFGASFFNTNDNCRHEVVTHEFFHFIVGLQHFYGSTNHAEAMRCPHHLARAVFDVALGQRLAPCDASGTICR